MKFHSDFAILANYIVFLTNGVILLDKVYLEPFYWLKSYLEPFYWLKSYLEPSYWLKPCRFCSVLLIGCYAPGYHKVDIGLRVRLRYQIVHFDWLTLTYPLVNSIGY